MRCHNPVLSTVILIAFGLPACLGVGLHWVDGGDCHHHASHTCCGAEHHHGGATDAPASIADNHICLICDFLVAAKQLTTHSDLPGRVDLVVATAATPDKIRIREIQRLAFLARGPPSSSVI